MRKAMLFLAMFTLTGFLWAADPIIGAWKLNKAASRTDTTVKEVTEVYRELDSGLIELTLTITGDGYSVLWQYIWPPKEESPSEFRGHRARETF